MPQRIGRAVRLALLPMTIALAVLLISEDRATAETLAVDTAVVFVVDTSASMDRLERRISRESHAYALTSRVVLNAIREGHRGRSAFSYVEFARSAAVRIGWTVVADLQSAQELSYEILALQDDGSPAGSTAIGAGLIVARHLIETLPWPADRLVVDVVGDGVENTGFRLDEARQELLEMGVIINGMPMLIDPSEHNLDRYFEARVIGGPGAFSIPLYEIRTMPMLLRQKLLMELF